MANILGIKISDFKKNELLEKITFLLTDQQAHFLVTPNPEIILKSNKDEEYFYILNKADLAVADGFGIVLAGLLQGQKIPRITGSDLTPLLLNLAVDKKLKTLIINWNKGLSTKEELKKTLKNNWPDLVFEILEIEKKDHLSVTENLFINNFSPQLVFNSLGAPWQEKIIWHELPNWPSVKLALAVGGSFDFLTNKIKRAPKILRIIGLEWLWRLIKQPQRFKRIWQATVIFSLKVLNSVIVQPFLFRPNVACLLYKKTPTGLKILIVKREDDQCHWQIPQGGTDGESITVAGVRELREELGNNKFIVKKAFKDLHVYEFPKANLSSGKTGYKGQKQGLLIAEFIGEDDDIKINYWDHTAWQWIDSNKFIETIHPIRKIAYKKFLTKLLETIN